jgi:hypothetical protein
MGGILPNSFQILLLSFTLNALHITNKRVIYLILSSYVEGVYQACWNVIFSYFFSQLFMCNGGYLQDGVGSKSSQLM